MFRKLNKEWIEIEYISDEHRAELDFEPSFWFNNKRYYLENFIRTHNNPWVTDDFPEFIHAYEEDNYTHPLFIELNESGDHLNVYEEVVDKT